MTHYIGLMSGTSLDGVDGALADFSGDAIDTLAAAYIAFPPTLRAELMALQSSGDNEIEREALAANQLAQFYAQCVTQLLDEAGRTADTVRAVAVHAVQAGAGHQTDIVGHCCFLKLKKLFCLTLRVVSHGTSVLGGALCT